MEFILEHQTAQELVTILESGWLVGWSDGLRARLEALLGRPEMQVYLRHHGRISQGRFTPEEYLSEIEGLLGAGLPESAYLAGWSALLEVDLTRAREQCRQASELLVSDGLAEQAQALLPAAARECKVMLSLLPDGQSSGYSHQGRTIVDALPLWLGQVGVDHFARRLAFTLFQVPALQIQARWLQDHQEIVCTVGEISAVRFLGRLVAAGVGASRLLRAPRELAPVEQARWADSAASIQDAVAEVADFLGRARDGWIDITEPVREHQRWASGFFSRYQIVGAGVIDRLLPLESRELREVVADPRRLPELLVSHGMPADLADWTLGLGRERSLAVDPLPRVESRDEPGLPHRWEQVLPDEPVTAVTVAIGAGSARDPAGREGLAHLVEHALVRRLDAACASAVMLHGYTEREATLYTFALDRATRGFWPRILGAVSAPLAVSQNELATLREEVAPELVTFRDGLGPRLQLQAEQALLQPPFGRSLVGDEDSLERIQPADLAEYHRRHYSPASLVVAAVGPVLPANPPAVAGSTPALAPLQARTTPVPAWPADAPEAPYLLVSLTADKQAPERYALAALRRFWAARLQESYGESVRAILTLYLGAGYLRFLVENPRLIGPAELRDRLRRWANEASDAELAAARTREIEPYENLKRNPQSLSIWLVGRGLFFAHEPADLEQEIEMVKRVEPGVMRRLAEHLLSPATTTWVTCNAGIASGTK